jgi:Mrp family chromosome partitioning ATPase
MSGPHSNPEGAARPDIETETADGEVLFGFSSELVVVDAPGSEASVALHAVAAQLMAQQLEQGRRGVAICGTSAGAGVTFLAANLAVSLAQAGVSTLLVDANLREPGLERIIAPSRPVPGLAQILRSDGTARPDVEQHHALPNLTVVYAGGPAVDAPDLLGAATLRDFILSSLRNFEFTVIDTPPANASADCRAISALVGYSLIVARRNVSFVDDVATLTAQLEEDGAVVIGALMNGT